MLKNISQLEHVVGDKVYHFMCDATSPLNEVKEALCQFMKFVGNIEDQIKAQQAARPTAEATNQPQTDSSAPSAPVESEQPKAE